MNPDVNKLCSLGDYDVLMQVHRLYQMYRSVRDVDNVQGQGVDGNSLYLPLNFALNLKLP